MVEDEEAVLEFERDVLTGAGAEVVTLMSSEDVKSRLAQEQFDAIIMNGKMPGGWSIPEVYRWIEQNVPGMDKRILFTFSTVAEPETRSFLQEKNVASLVKPFEVADLIAQARRLLPKALAAGAN